MICPKCKAYCLRYGYSDNWKKYGNLCTICRNWYELEEYYIQEKIVVA